MLVVVNTIAPLVFIYSIGYMAKEEGYWRLLRRAVAVPLLDARHRARRQLRDDLHLLGVGRCQLLHPDRPLLYEGLRGRRLASRRFLVNRIGDFGFMLGILMLWFATGTVMFSRARPGGEISSALKALADNPAPTSRVACVLVFCGTVGKIRPASAACLAAELDGRPHAGLLAAPRGHDGGGGRLHAGPLLPGAGLDPVALEVIAWVGGLTCLVAGLMATQQNDIKRILAYSTISQLGYMVLGVGVASTWGVPMFPPSSRTPSSSACSSSAPAPSSSACTTSRTSGRWAP